MLVKAGPRLPLRNPILSLAQEVQIVFQGIAALWPEGFSESEGFLLEDTQSFDLMPQKRISGPVRTKQSCKVY